MDHSVQCNRSENAKKVTYDNNKQLLCRTVLYSVYGKIDYKVLQYLHCLWAKQGRRNGSGSTDLTIIWQSGIFMFTLYQLSRTWVDSSRTYAI